MKKIILVLLYFTSLSANATIVEYDEAVSGDIFADTFDLGVGANTITGNLSIGLNRDLDGFRFNVADSNQLDSFIFSFSNVVPNESNSLFGIGYGLARLNPSETIADPETQILFNNIFIGEFPAVDSPTNFLTESLPVGAGLYSLILSETTLGTANPGGVLDYTITLNVTESITPSAVPIPGAIWLFGSALIGFAGFRRKFRI